jgi:hypothetical protein
MGIRLRSLFVLFPKLAIASTVALTVALTAALVGCQPKGPSAEATSKTGEKTGEKTAEEGALPSMSSYTLEKSGDPPPSDKPVEGKSSQADALSAGEYCFHKAGDKNWLSIRLQISDDQKLTGESAGTVNQPEQGETRYKQTFVGAIADGQAQVEVTTYIAEVTESRPETWIVSADQLDMGRVAIPKAACPEISSSF